MTSKIIVAIVAIVAAVLSLAAPVDVEAQSPTLTVVQNVIGDVQINYSGFTSGTTYYVGWCRATTAAPASCAFDSSGNPQSSAAALVVGCTVSARTDNTQTSGWFWSDRDWQYHPNTSLFFRVAAYSDSACQTEVASVTYQRPLARSSVTWNVRNITDTEATIYIEQPFSPESQLISYWYSKLTPGSGACTHTFESWSRSPTPVLTGLSPGTTYRYGIYFPDRINLTGHPAANCHDLLNTAQTVTFTTEYFPPSGPAPPETPTEVETTTDADGGSVTISWANPGDSTIATYEYLLRRDGQPVGEWTTVPGSNADTTSVTIDLATGAVVAVNNATPPMVEWTIDLRARDTNGSAGGIFSTTVNATTAGPTGPDGPGETVPALPLAGLVTLALVLFLGGQRQRKGNA